LQPSPALYVVPEIKSFTMIVHYYRNQEFVEDFEIEILSEDDSGFEFSAYKFPPPSIISGFKTEDERWINVSEIRHEDTEDGRLFFYRAEYF
jgi:hypothetical protein